MGIEKKDKILITGGWGFLGTHLTDHLRINGYRAITRVRSRYCDLRNQKLTRNYIKRHQPKCIIHLAGVVGGIGANKESPGRFFYDNMQMGLNVLESAREFYVEKTIIVGTVCAYPKFTEVPFKEVDLWKGYPEETNAPYGIAKRALMEMGRTYHQQYGMDIISLIPTNLYGPGDNFSPKNSHVIPALILKFWLAMKKKRSIVTCWGTGSPSREFLFVRDCAKAIQLAIEKYDKPDPVNIGTGWEINIRDLVAIIANKMGYMGGINFDASKPDGQPRRCLNVQKAYEEFGFEAETTFEVGLQETIEWFERHADEITRSLGLQV
jgi:GDP-L-fucose synthase